MYSTSKTQNINISKNINVKKFLNHNEYTLTHHFSGPFGTSPPNVWCERLKTRCETY